MRKITNIVLGTVFRELRPIKFLARDETNQSQEHGETLFIDHKEDCKGKDIRQD